MWLHLQDPIRDSARRKTVCLSIVAAYWQGPARNASGASLSYLAMNYHYLFLLLSDESAPAPRWGAGLYLMGSFSRGLLGGSLLQTHLKTGLWISWLPGRSLLLSIRWSPRLYPSVNGPQELDAAVFNPTDATVHCMIAGASLQSPHLGTFHFVWQSRFTAAQMGIRCGHLGLDRDRNTDRNAKRGRQRYLVLRRKIWTINLIVVAITMWPCAFT